jgi:hypothetical protein
MSTALAAEVAAVLEAFGAEQRARALDETKRTRITLTRTVSSGFQLGFETVVDQAAEKAEIDALLDRMVGAAERQEAVAQLEQDIQSLAIDQGTLAGQIKDLARREAEYRAENERVSAGRREAIALSKQQRAALDQLRTGIEEAKRTIDRRRERMAQCRRIIAGESRLAVAQDPGAAADKVA